MDFKKSSFFWNSIKKIQLKKFSKFKILKILTKNIKNFYQKKF